MSGHPPASAAPRVALVTGAGRGIGRAIAHGLSADGFAVAVNDIDADAADAVARELVEAGGTAVACPASVVDPMAVRSMVRDIEDRVGRPSVLVNNAGTSSAGRTLLRTDPAELEALLALNVVGPLTVCQAVLPAMRANGGGAIVWISSTAARQLQPCSGPYSVAKLALEGLALTMAREEHRHGIRVNVVAPGMVDTRLGRTVADRMAAAGAIDPADVDAILIRPEDIADCVRFLVAPSSSQISGQRLEVGLP